MLFNSIPFCLFLPIVFACYWLIGNKRIKLQNLLLLSASYLFYGWWDYRFLGLIVLSSFVDFLVARKIESSVNHSSKKKWFYLSLAVNLGILGIFKYFNFFIDSFFTLFGMDGGNLMLEIILPVGISFYTFQTLSYSIDVYRGKLKAINDPLAFFTFVAFFPQLVAGPIERAKDLLPQFIKPRIFDYAFAAQGLRQMLWGFFKKLVIADNCGPIVDQIFANYVEASMLTLWLGAILFAFQIYCDFSGYSDIAIGTARLFGIELKQNFAFPYFSRDVAEFWRRWHISLTTWFRDYLYIPLGGSRGNKSEIIRNVFCVFLISGLWHGANWTFIVWGLIHACLFIPLIVQGKHRKYLLPITKSERFLFQALQVFGTFMLVTIAWVFFRAPDLGTAFQYLSKMLAFENGKGTPFSLNVVLISILALLIFEWIYRKDEYGFAIENVWKPLRWSMYIGISLIILLFGKMESTSFIYFAF